MVIGLRAVGTYADTNFNGFAPLSGGDTPFNVDPGPGRVIVLQAYAQVTQTGAVGDPTSGGTGWPVFSTADGRFVSSNGGIKVDFFGHFPANSASGSGSQPGTFIDLDGDGDIDIGNTDANAASAAGWVRYRANGPGGVNGPGATISPTSSTSIYAQDFPGGGVGTIAPKPIPGGYEYYLGEVDFTITSSTGLFTALTWQFRPQAGNATWFENATRTVTPGKSATGVTFSGGTIGQEFSSGPPVIIVVPEPASTGALAGLAALGLLVRRHKPS
jgi:hypothetical protein